MLTKKQAEKKIKSAVKYISKSPLLIMQARESDVLISNSYYLVRVSAAVYESYFRGVAPDFIELHAGEAAIRDSRFEKGAIMEKRADAPRLEKVVTDNAPQNVTLSALVDTGYIRKPAGDSSGFAQGLRVYINKNGELVAVNEEFRAALDVFANGDFSQSAVCSPLCCEGVFNDKHESGLLILPVRFDFAAAKYAPTEAGGKTEKELRRTRELLEAAEYKISELIEESKTDTVRDAEKRARAIVSEAQREAAKIREEAEHAAALIDGKKYIEAEKRGAALIAKSTAEAHAIKEAANKEAATILAEARKEARATIKETEKRRLEVVRELHAEKQAAGQQAAQQEEKPAAESKKARIVRNEEAHGIEIYFNDAPRAQVRNVLKGNGFRWHATKKCWYAKHTQKAAAVAYSLVK